MSKHKFNRSVDVLVTLPADYATVLANWASVSRTLNAAKALLTDYVDSTSGINDDVDVCIGELRDLEPALNNLHANVRGALWVVSKERAE